MKLIPSTIAALFALHASASAQLVFSQQLQNGNTGLFQQQQNGQVSLLNTGASSTNFPSISRDGRFIVFSRPDLVEPASGLPPSSDLVLFDRATGQSQTLINNQTQVLPGPNGTLQTGVTIPQFNAISPDGQLVAFVNRLTLRTGIANPQTSGNLNLVGTNGAMIGTVESGSGAAYDLLRSEFVGFSWAPDGNSFATSAYIIVPTQTIGPRPVIGIVRYARNGSGQFVRSGALSTPTVVESVGNFGATIQIFPAFSPSGAGLAYFDIYVPDSTFFQQPATARLIVANGDGSGARVLTTFNPGFYPLGLTWSADGTQLVFSIAQQAREGNAYITGGQPQTAVVRAVSSSTGGTPFQLPGVNGGFFPGLPFSGGGGIPTVDLSEIEITLTPASNGGFLLRAPGLDPGTNYLLESSTDLRTFSNAQAFSGQTFANGIPIPRQNLRAKFFRVRSTQ